MDDSFTFCAEFDVISFEDKINEILLNEYASRWLDGAEILDTDIMAEYSAYRNYIYGWVLMSGSPKENLGWQKVEYEGKEAYCRWIDTRSEGESCQYEFKKPLAMLPLKKADIPPYGTENRLEGLESAELYVRQLDKSFKISDAESLRILEKGFTRKSYLDYYNANHLILSDFTNPLFLNFSDGRRMLVSTSGNGSCGADLWDGFCGFYSNVSPFELFGVPLEAEGYEHNPDGTTTVYTVLSELDRSSESFKFIESNAETDFSAVGDMLRVYRNFNQHFSHYQGLYL